MRLRHLEVFRAVMLTGTVSEAARYLNVSQPVVSRTLQHAELQAGFRLFERIRGRLQPTPEARALYVEAERVFGEFERLKRLSANLRRRGSGHLRVAATPSLGESLLPGALARFHRQHPEASLELQTLHTGQIVAALLANEVDLAFAIAPPAHEAVQAASVGSGEIVLACPAQRRNSAPLTFAIGEFADLPLITLDDQTPLGMLAAEALAGAGPLPASFASVQTYTLARSMVGEGLGCALLDQYSAASGDSERLAVYRLARPLSFEIHALRAMHRPQSLLSSAFSAAFTETVANCDTAARQRWLPGRVDLGG